MSGNPSGNRLIIFKVCSCFGASYDETTLHEMRKSLPRDNIEASRTVLDLLQRTNYKPLQKAIRHLTTALQYNGVVVSSSENMVSHLGRCWIALSRVILDLFVPNIPIDPAAMIRHAALYAQEQADFLRQQIAFHVKFEHRTAANQSNGVISYLEACARDLFTPHVLADVPTRNNLTNLRTYWLEVSQFISQVIHQSKIDDLAHALETGDTSALDREVVVQDSISSFCQRIEDLYTEFDDITCILRLAFAELRLGLHLMRWASQQSSSQKDATELMTSLAAFPSIRSAQLLLALPTTNVGIPAAELVMLRVAAAMHCTQLSSAPMTVNIAYDQAYRLWSIDRARDDRRERDLSSLYRTNKMSHEVSMEAEAEEREFLELFPTFEDVLHPPDVSDAHVSDKPAHHLTPEGQRQLLALHLEFIGDLASQTKTVHTTSKFTTLRQSFLRSWIGIHPSSLPDSLDTQSLHLQLSVLHEHLSDICGTSSPSSKSFDFYADANISEAKKASSVIKSLRARLISVFRDWPDQMVLQHLIDRCDIILSFDFAAPVAKFLSALEQLLVQTEDWEMYANRDNSLKEHRHELITLIVEWRRLELSCWKSLLESQSQSFIGGVTEFWFRLYEVLVRGPLNAVEESTSGDVDNLQGYLKQLPSLLDEFIQSSSLGQFQVRLDLLRSFEAFVHFIAPQESPTHQDALLRVGRIVHSSWRYFNIFVPSLFTLLRDQRRGLEKEVEAFIKLASWKDVNVQALKQSAHKTHHQLYKLISKFRDVLRQPVMDKMNPLFAGDAEGHHLAEHIVFPVSLPLSSAAAFTEVISSSVSVPAHLGNLQQTFGKFNGFISTTIRRFLSKYTAEDVEQLSLDIILTARNLASHTIPPDLTKEKREKHKKNLLLRKRKAWNDLLKELKRGGLAYNVKPDVLSKLRDECWVRNQPLIPANSIMASVEKAEHYFDRLRGCLPALRKVLSDHHSDLGTRDLSRGLSLVESGYFLALEGRSGYAFSSIDSRVFHHDPIHLGCHKLFLNTLYFVSE